MKHWHKNHTVGYNPRRLLSNSPTIIRKSPRILSGPCGFSAQRPLPVTLQVWMTETMVKHEVLFDSEMSSCLHPGEIEALAVIQLNRDNAGLYFCTGDAKAVEALVLMGLRSKGVSLELLLSRADFTSKIPLHFSESRFHLLVERA